MLRAQDEGFLLCGSREECSVSALPNPAEGSGISREVQRAPGRSWIGAGQGMGARPAVAGFRPSRFGKEREHSLSYPGEGQG